MEITTRPACEIEGCGSPIKARGLCGRHYNEDRSRRTGQYECSVEGCPKPARTRGFCSAHYHRWNKTGDAGEAALRRKPARPCIVEDCSNGATTSRDLCPTHAQRKRLYGTETGTFVTHKKCVECGSPAMHGPRSSEHCQAHYVVLVLDLHLAGIEPGNQHPNGYRYLNVRKKQYAIQRLVMERKLGRELLPGETPHHLNGIRDDNRPENLELWVKPQPCGQRPEDLVSWVVFHYPELVAAELRNRNRELRTCQDRLIN